MKLNFAEQLLVNNPVRAAIQMFYEGPLLRKLGGSVPGGTVLEVGCGQGSGIDVIFRHFGVRQIYGIDLDPLQIERARRRLSKKDAERVTLLAADAEQLPFADQAFDAVFDFGALHHVPKWQQSIAEIARVLKPGGTFFFEEVTRAALQRWIYRRFFEHPADNRFSEAEFIAEIAGQGFEPAGPLHQILFGDIFIGAARLTSTRTLCSTNGSGKMLIG